MGIIVFDFTFFFQLFNTGLLLIVCYLVVRWLKNYKRNKNELERRVQQCEKELKL